ncbi:nucleotidyltransferase family protein [Chitinophagaceae bacterium LB-8]|uniref:Nucleotidyltransferase family protein n=1 Tax=Paraflavisolibacter caeni TaxID=2982496 RepID=A0A9X2XW88_9BACT|nr:nucleotidyltransferase family protein [Paraflavisolibacter caeni]MCU7550376.1 nucleotidyltransferase family protein [Paraflavisolibacter caeni]
MAAGASRRLGKPKQLLQFDGKSLLQHNINTALGANANQVVVMLGANAEALEKEIDQQNIHVIINTEWQEGMASSIRCGLNAILTMAPSSDGIILMLCDQPFVTASLLNDLLKTHKETSKPVITCSYGNTFGPPTFFHKSMFSELLQLKGDTGARKIVQQYANNIVTIPFSQGHIDIDTQSDYENLTSVPPQAH